MMRTNQTATEFLKGTGKSFRLHTHHHSLTNHTSIYPDLMQTF